MYYGNYTKKSWTWKAVTLNGKLYAYQAKAPGTGFEAQFEPTDKVLRKHFYHDKMLYYDAIERIKS